MSHYNFSENSQIWRQKYVTFPESATTVLFSHLLTSSRAVGIVSKKQQNIVINILKHCLSLLFNFLGTEDVDCWENYVSIIADYNISAVCGCSYLITLFRIHCAFSKGDDNELQEDQLSRYTVCVCVCVCEAMPFTSCAAWCVILSCWNNPGPPGKNVSKILIFTSASMVLSHMILQVIHAMDIELGVYFPQRQAEMHSSENWFSMYLRWARVSTELNGILVTCWYVAPSLHSAVSDTFLDVSVHWFGGSDDGGSSG